MKLKKKIWVVLLSAILICSSTLPCFAASQQWVELKPARLVSFTYYKAVKCSVCGQSMGETFECVLAGELNGRKTTGPAMQYRVDKDAGYDCSGSYYCVNPKLVGYKYISNNESIATLYCSEAIYNHLNSHGIDKNGNNAEAVLQYKIYYNEQYKNAEGYFTPIEDAPEVEKASSEVSNASVKEALAMVKASTKKAATCPFVKTIKLKKGKKSFTARWKKASKKQQKKFTGYQIQYSTKRDFSSNVKTKSTKKRSASKVVIRKLKKKTTYYVRLRKFKKSGKNVIYSKWSTVKKVRTR